ncbi:hypothetical protein AURDEDRAFT_174793 [Auricularia subglabra TFB-10046 SS5]|nr:hypothetical protein AURDEDRAFT_174793 [Auricularia subglabra TFB-10046 SS5]
MATPGSTSATTPSPARRHRTKLADAGKQTPAQMVKARERLPGRVPHDKQYDDRVDPTLVLSESSASQSDDDLPRRPTPSPATPPQFPDVYAAPKTFTHAASRSHSPVSSAATRSSSAQQPSQALPRSRHRALRSIADAGKQTPAQMVKARERLSKRVPGGGFSNNQERVDATPVRHDPLRPPAPDPVTPWRSPAFGSAARRISQAESRSQTPTSRASERSPSAQQPGQTVMRSRMPVSGVLQRSPATQQPSRVLSRSLTPVSVVSMRPGSTHEQIQAVSRYPPPASTFSWRSGPAHPPPEARSLSPSVIPGIAQNLNPAIFPPVVPVHVQPGRPLPRFQSMAIEDITHFSQPLSHPSQPRVHQQSLSPVHPAATRTTALPRLRGISSQLQFDQAYHSLMRPFTTFPSTGDINPAGTSASQAHVHSPSTPSRRISIIEDSTAERKDDAKHWFYVEEP